MSRGKIFLSILALAAAGMFGVWSVSPSTATRDPSIPLPKEIVQANHVADGEREIYLAGGCFWGTEELLRNVRGVTSVTCVRIPMTLSIECEIRLRSDSTEATVSLSWSALTSTWTSIWSKPPCRVRMIW